jgi:hypothetical protein
MRTKILLIAAAALAAGVVSTQAQVYSQNIVGYVNETFTPGVYTLVNAPLETTPTNAPEDSFPGLQTGDSILFWTGSAYNSYLFISPGQWVYPDGSTIGPAPNLGTGSTGFFYLNGQGTPETNTFVGTVVLSNSVSFSPGIYQLVGSTPPIGVSSLEDTNLNLPLQTGDSVLYWTGTGYSDYLYVGPGQWVEPDSSIGAAPALNVGQGFFYLNGQGTSETWTNSITVQ